MARFGRLVTAMITPFTKDLQVDYAGAATVARWLVDQGSDAIVVAGTTGESPTLTTTEKERLFAAVVAAVGDTAQVLAGTGSNSTAASIELTRRAEAVGVHGIMLVGPYYNKPPAEGMYRHFAAVAEATRLPVMLYNVPTRTAKNIDAGTVVRLSRIENIVAVKEASGDLDQISRIIEESEPGFEVYSGDDPHTLAVMAVGGEGVVSVAGHLIGPQLKAMMTAFAAGQIAEAARLHRRWLPLMQALFATTNPILVKAGVAMVGLPAGGLRLPLVEATAAERETLRRVMAECGLPVQ